MKILSLQAENIKRLQVVEMKPAAKGLVIVSGKNGEGKSSLLDSIEIGLRGGLRGTGAADSVKMPSKPVRRGEDKARIDMELGDKPDVPEFTIKRVITATGGGSLVVKDKDGEPQKSPQALLDALFKRTIDPMEFRAQKAEQRSETLRNLVGLDFTTTDAEIDRIFNERTIINREVKNLEVQLKACPEHEGAGSEEVNPAELNAKLEQAFKFGEAKLTAARKHNEANAKVKARWQESATDLTSAVKDASGCDREIVEIKRQIAELEQSLKTWQADREKAAIAVDTARAALFEREKEVAALKYEDEDAIREENRLLREPIQKAILDVDASNRKARDNQKKAGLRASHKTKAREAETLSTQIDKLEKTKREAIQNAKFPVPGLTLSDTKEVLFNNIPFDQCSTAEQIRISVAMGLAMNPRLRVLLIRQGNDLDDDNLRLVGEMASEADAQVWIERVSTAGDVAVIIEDGQVKLTEPKAEQETLAV